MNSVERCINYVELFYSTHLTTGIAGTLEAENFALSLVQLPLSLCVDISIKTATRSHEMPNCQNC
jgi:hypothetical protein